MDHHLLFLLDGNPYQNIGFFVSVVLLKIKYYLIINKLIIPCHRHLTYDHQWSTLCDSQLGCKFNRNAHPTPVVAAATLAGIYFCTQLPHLSTWTLRHHHDHINMFFHWLNDCWCNFKVFTKSWTNNSEFTGRCADWTSIVDCGTGMPWERLLSTEYCVEHMLSLYMIMKFQDKEIFS